MRNFTKKFALLILGLSLAFVAEAQKVSGTVKDSAGDPIIGASVVVDGTTNGTSTGVSGEWSLDIPNASQQSLVFSYLGMKDQKVAIGNRTHIDVVLESDAEVMEDVVVVGYATVQRKDLIGSVSSVNSETLVAQPVTSVSEALSGKMAGVQVTTTEGDPDADIKIRVRGGGSITQDSSPLYIVDGFPVESINDIPSSDIQSIDVLKDAFSTAIYGSRGANGVIIVTTKSGKEGRLTVNYNGYTGVKTIANKDAITTLDPYEFVKVQYEAALLRDNVSDNYEPFFGKFADIDLYQGIKGNDYVAQVFGNQGSTSNHNVSLSGGGKNFNWTASYSHMGDNAIMKGSSYSRDNLNLKTKFKPNNKLSFDFHVRYSDTQVRGSGSNSVNDTGSTSGNGRLKHAISYTPIPLESSIEGSDLEEDYGDNAPPMQSVADNDSRRHRQNWNINGAISLKLAKGLTLKVDGGLDTHSQTDDRFYGLTTYYVAQNSTVKNQPATQYKDYDRTKLRNTNTLHYNIGEALDWDESKLDILVGQEYLYTKSNQLTTWVDGLPSFFDAEMAWNFMASGSNANSVNNFFNQDDKLLSFFSRVNYDWNGILSLSATMRADGSSKFLGANRWGYFPSAAAALRLSEIGPLQDIEALDNLKLRYSYGTAGNNNIPVGQTMQTFKASTSSWISQGTTYWSAGETMPNPDLKWETTYSHNLGLDYSFFGGKVSGSFEVYKNNTKDLLIQFPTSGSGYKNQYRNMGETENKGFEASLNLTIFQTKNAGLTISANASYNRNKVVTLGGLSSIESETQWASTEIGTDYLVEEGQPLGNMYGYQSDGFYTVDDFNYVDGKWELKEGVVDASGIVGGTFLRPGARKYKDQPTAVKDENGNITGYECDGKITVADKVIIGNALADWTGGLIISGYIGNFDFSANFNAVLGNDIYNANLIEFTSIRKYYNRNLLAAMSTDQRWTNVDWTTGELITDPEALAAANEGKTAGSPFIQNAVFSDAAVEDGSFLRLTSATIGYTIPERLTKRIGIDNLRLYVSGTNLWLLTNYSGYDPEVDTRRKTPLTPGVDYSAYPKSTGVVFGLNLSF